MLLMPLTVVDDEFEIWIDHNDSTQSEDDPPGRVEPPSLDLLLYKYDFAVITRGKGWQVRRTIYRGGELLEDTEDRKKLSSDLEGQQAARRPAGIRPHPRRRIVRGFILLCARLRGPAAKDACADGGARLPRRDSGGAIRSAGQRLARSASEEGLSAGLLSDSARGSLRRGCGSRGMRILCCARRLTARAFVENDAYLAFLALCRAEWNAEEIVLEEYVEPKWETPAEERRSSAQARRELRSVAYLRAVMHGVKPPVGTANATLDRLQTLISRRVADQELQAELQELHDKTARQVARIGEAIRRVLEMVDFDPTPVHFDVVTLVRKVIDTEFKPDAPDVRFDVDLDGERSIDMPPAPLEEAIMAELVRNAIEAPRSNGATPTVGVSRRGCRRMPFRSW